MNSERIGRRAAITGGGIHAKISTKSIEEHGICEGDVSAATATTATAYGSDYLSSLKDANLLEGFVGHRNGSTTTLQTVDSTSRSVDDSVVRESGRPTTTRNNRNEKSGCGDAEATQLENGPQTFSNANVKTPKQQRSILILGVSGRTGTECLRQFAESQDAPLLFGFCREMKSMQEETMLLCRKHCEELIEGDATRAVDLYRALQISRADTIMVCLGGDTKGKKSTVRTESAISLVKVLVHPPFHHVRVIVISSVGAGDSQTTSAGAASLACIVPQGGSGAACILPSLGKNRRHHVLDHQGQEEVFSMNRGIRARTTLVRPTPFTEEAKTRKIATFQSGHKPPNPRTLRRDLAKWLVTESSYHIHEGKAVNVTSV